MRDGTPTSSEEATLPAEPGASRAGDGNRDRVGRYAIRRLLGVGGMGRVYEAFDADLDRPVAVKVLRRAMTANSRARLRREAMAMAMVNHPNVVQVFEVGEHEGELYIAMELIEGESLATWQKEAGRSWREILTVYLAAGAGLAAAHDAGLIHRDFKPHNVMVSGGGATSLRVRVLDFGLALGGVDDQTSGSSDPSQFVGTLTATGQLSGTPAYMAPEQLGRGPLTAAADEFAFCVALWEGLYGRRPFDGDSVGELAVAVLEGTITDPPGRARVPRWVKAVLLRGLSREPGARFGSMRELSSALRRDPRRRWLVAGGGAVMLVAAGVAGWVGSGAQACGGGHDRLGGVWDEPRRAQVGAAIEATDVAFAERARERALRRIDTYASAWETMYAEACSAAGKRSEAKVIDVRMACLERAMGRLESVVSVLADADPTVVRNVDDVLEGLESLERCANVDELGATPVPADERGEVEAVRRLVDRARAERNAKRFGAAEDWIAQAKHRLADLSYRPVAVEVVLAEGHLRSDQARYEEAEQLLREALAQALQERQWDTAQEAGTSLMLVVGFRLRGGAEALRFRDVVEEHLVEGSAREARLRNVLGLIYGVEGQSEAAEAEYRRAVEIYSALPGREVDAAGSLAGVASALADLGKHTEAEAAYREAIRATDAAVGELHPVSAGARLGLARTLFRAGKFVAAQEEQETVLKILEASLEPDHPDLAAAHNNLGGMLALLGEAKAAEAEFRLALSIREKAFAPNNPLIAEARSNLGLCLTLLGRPGEAEVELRRALAARVASLGDEHHDVGLTRHALADALAAQGNLADAEKELRRAVEILRAALPPDHPELSLAVVTLADVLEELGRYGEARPFAEEAWASTRREDISAGDKARAEFALARVFAESSDRKERSRARQLAEGALVASDSVGKGEEELSRKIEAWLGAH